jgi:hypothetical protein
MEIVRNFLAAEARIQLPTGWETDRGEAIRPPDGLHVATCLSRHDAVVLRSRLRKQEIDRSRADLICDSFNISDPSKRDAVGQCLLFLERQADHFTSDDERTILVIGPDIDSTLL